MIGLSLSYCVKDILKGNIDLENVQKIITATRAKTEEDWKEIINHYMRSYWKEFTDEEVYTIIERLIIEQPRLQNDQHYPLIVKGIRWVESEAQITWQDQR